MFIIGIDLSGPSNIKDTAYVCFEEQKGALHLAGPPIMGASDEDIFNLTKIFSENDEVIIGIDAPLSYNPGGGLRPSDRELKKKVIEAGLHPGSVMPPTLMRMAYLTLRGLAVARLIEAINPTPPKIVEVHPGAAMALRGAPTEWVRTFKKDAEARIPLLRWLETQELHGLLMAHDEVPPEDHLIAAYAAALAAWKWERNEAVWLVPAKPPIHPYDFSC